MARKPLEYVNFRASAEDVARINALAAERNMTRTAFILAACLGQLIDPAGIEKELEELRTGMHRVERALFEP